MKNNAPPGRAKIRVKTNHRQINLQIHGQSVTVDDGIQNLITLVNSLPEVETYNSCRGDLKNKAYIHFGGKGALDLLPMLASQIFKESLQKRGTSLCLDINYVGIALRWRPRDYPRVVGIFQMLVKISRQQKSKRLPFWFSLLAMKTHNPPIWIKVTKQEDRL
jgi:hypothetical protein